jgi:hypothetical protein
MKLLSWFRRKSSLRKQDSKVFVAPKTHGNRRALYIRIYLVIGFLLVTAVVTLLVVQYKQEAGAYFKDLWERLLLRKPATPREEKSIEQKIWNKLNGQLFEVTTVENMGEYLTVQTRQGTVLFISSEKSLDDQVRTLQTLLAKARIDKRELAIVDFRFDKLVVSYK